MIEVKIDDTRLTAQFARIIKGARNASPLMAAIAGIMMDEVEENFAQQGRPKWQGFKYTPSEKRGGSSAKLLQNSGQLASSITPSSTSSSAVVGTNKKYAAIHQFGGKTSPHIIKPRNKKALAFGGRVVKSVNHPGSNIPARPFLSITQSGENEILNKTSQYLRSLIY